MNEKTDRHAKFADLRKAAIKRLESEKIRVDAMPDMDLRKSATAGKAGGLKL